MNKRKITIFAVTLLFAAISMSSCAQKKKYGCPTHMAVRILNLF